MNGLRCLYLPTTSFLSSLFGSKLIRSSMARCAASFASPCVVRFGLCVFGENDVVGFGVGSLLTGGKLLVDVVSMCWLGSSILGCEILSLFLVKMVCRGSVGYVLKEGCVSKSGGRAYGLMSSS